VSLLTRLETDLRDALARAFTDSRVSLVDVGRALLVEDEAAGVPDDRRVFDVALHPDDLEGLQAHAGALCRRLSELVADQRAERSGSRGGDVDVRLGADPRLAPGVFRVHASADGLAPGSSGGEAVGSHVIASSDNPTVRADGAADQTTLLGRPRLVVVLGGTVVSGTEFAEGEMIELELDERVAVVGSAPDANLLLPADMAAPHHVEVRYREDGYHEAVAIGGAPLRVNGQPGIRGLLTDGARLELGEVAIVYRREFVARDASGAGREGFSRTDGA
jgi:hypothetical protein